MNRRWIVCIVGILLTGCSYNTQRQFIEALLANRNPITFEVNAVRHPIFNCSDSPDPRYPCEGMGPEGFVRDLVVKPFANKRALNIIDHDKKKSFRITWTWFSMQGSCNGGERANLQLMGGRGFGRKGPIDPKYEVGITYLSAQKRAERWRRKDGESIISAWPPQPVCAADYVDLSAGRPFSAALWLYVPEPNEKSPAQKTPKHSKFETGCREEKRNGLTWSVCLTAGQEWPGGPHGFLETQLEMWKAHLNDSGFIISIYGWYKEPLYLWPQWYAERQAALLEVIDSVRFENLSYDQAQSTNVISTQPVK